MEVNVIIWFIKVKLFYILLLIWVSCQCFQSSKLSLLPHCFWNFKENDSEKGSPDFISLVEILPLVDRGLL